ncbi:hypothetical protein Ddc_15699 [Ditylenchus destructor]|nr:hypothetical protein Ddc_15699 [Ditylenchus destructor]
MFWGQRKREIECAWGACTNSGDLPGAHPPGQNKTPKKWGSSGFPSRQAGWALSKPFLKVAAVVQGNTNSNNLLASRVLNRKPPYQLATAAAAVSGPSPNLKREELASGLER